MNDSPTLTISIATWNNRDLVAACLRSLEESGVGCQPARIGVLDTAAPFSCPPSSSPPNIDAEIFVVDNASTDGTAEMIREKFPRVRLLRNTRPLGFSANHNQVLRQAAGRFVLLLNDDTAILDDALVRAVRFLDGHPDAGAVGGTLLKPDGTPERIAQRFPHPLDPIFPSLRRKVDPRNEPAAPADAVEVERWSGACLMIRREVLGRIGWLDERFDPAYGEDTDLCYRIKQAGWRIYRLPAARVIHHRGRTAQREWPDQARRLQEAKFRWYRKHRRPAALWLYKTSVVLASIAQLAACLPRLLSPRRRTAAREKLRRCLGRLRALFPRSTF